MAIILKDFTFSPNTIEGVSTHATASFKARVGDVADSKVDFSLVIEDAAQMVIIDPDGNDVKAYPWSQNIDFTWAEYTIVIEFKVTESQNKLVPAEIVLNGTDQHDNLSSRGTPLFYK